MHCYYTLPRFIHQEKIDEIFLSFQHSLLSFQCLLPLSSQCPLLSSQCVTLGSHFLISQYKLFQIAPICKYINIIILHKNLDPSVTHWDDKKRRLLGWQERSSRMTPHHVIPARDAGIQPFHNHQNVVF